MTNEFNEIKELTKKAKEKNAIQFLNSIGIQYVKKYGNLFYYNAPFRNDDENASMFVNADNNTFYDRGGTHKQGDLITLVCLIENCSFKDAVLKINGISPISYFSKSEPLKKETESSTIEIKHIQPIQNKALIQYLQSRKIALPLAQIYLKEAYYKVGEYQYFALAFKNNSDGYELRNNAKSKNFPKGYKGCAGSKDITTIQANGTGLNIFEGFFNFLSALTHYEQSAPTQTTIILNSTSNFKKAIPELQKFNSCNAFLDNDTAGTDTLLQLQKIIPATKNRANEIYPAYNDFNEYLCSFTK